MGVFFFHASTNRLYQILIHIGKKFFFALANELIPVDQPGTYNQSVMEFGALHCLPLNPNCDDCIFKKNCVAFKQEKIDSLPVKIRRQKKTNRYFNYFLIRIGDKILMNERTGKDIWKGLLDFPLLETKRKKAAGEILREEFPLERDSYVSNDYQHILTHQLIHVRFVEFNWPAGKKPPSAPLFAKARLYSLKQVEKLPKPILIARYLEERGIL